ncbi:Cmx/CmrA family chloramphenicol efflux MFS transporter [Gordonia sp. CPCC 205333]|uniref:Cmx/CmrA family chloramphenicol efflux MFS transporter n=1 Tax=Gordonia sp. CPCC 205333 TaxID=3140790 RepID=UPI003AF3317B
MPFALYLLALAAFALGTSEFMLAGLIPAIASDLDVAVGTAGLLTSAFAIGMVVGAPTMAAFARRWPPRVTLLACLVLFAGCHVAGAITPMFSILLATRVVGALANAGFLAVALTTATTLVPADRKGRALAILLSGTTIATVAGVPAGALLGTAFGWRAPFWAVALLCVPAAVGILCGMDKRQPASVIGATDLKAELSELRSTRLILAMALGALINGGTFAAFTYLAPVVTETARLADSWISVALVMFGIGSFAGVTVAGRLSDRWPGLALTIGGPLLLIGWIALAALAPLPGFLLVLIFIQGMLSFCVGSTLITRILYAASTAPTMAGSYATAALNMGAAAGPVLGALALTVGPGVLAPVWVAAGLTSVGLIILLAARDQRTTGVAIRPR